MDIVFFIVCEINLFGFRQRVGFEGNKTVFTSPEAMVTNSLVS